MAIKKYKIGTKNYQITTQKINDQNFEISLKNGKKEESPARFKGLSPGTHEIRVEQKDFKTIVKKVKLKPGEKRLITIDLKKE